MKKRILPAVTAFMLVAVGAALAQQPGALPTPPLPSFEGKSVRIAPPKTSVPGPKPEEMTAEELLERVKRIRAQKEELDKEEQGLMKVLTKKVDKLKTEINTLNGVAQPVAPPGAAFPDSIPSPSIGIPAALPTAPGKP